MLALPNLLNTMDKSRQTSTLNNMRTIGQALERYAIDHESRYPKGTSLAALETKLVPTYIKELPLDDGWKHPLRYDVNDSRASFTLRALGKDGELQQDNAATEDIDPFERDIVMVDGAFTQKPAGEARDEDDTPEA